MKKLILTILAITAALGFAIPEGAENVKRSFDENGNERVSYSLNKIAVAGIKTNLKKGSFESSDTMSVDKSSMKP